MVTCVSATGSGQGDGVADQALAHAKSGTRQLMQQLLHVVDGDEAGPAGFYDQSYCTDDRTAARSIDPG